MEILEKLAKRTIEYFKNELRLEINKNFTIREVNKIKLLNISSVISLSKDMSGSLVMSVSKELAEKMLQGFMSFEIKEEERQQLSQENVAETLNILLGNILQDLSLVKQGGTVNISTPYTINTSLLSKKENAPMYLCTLKIKSEILILSYF